MPGRPRPLGAPERQAAPPDQSRIIIGPVRHPIAHLGDLVAPVGIGFVGHGSISQRNQPVLRADARAVTRPAHNLRYIRAPTPRPLASTKACTHPVEPTKTKSDEPVVV